MVTETQEASKVSQPTQVSPDEIEVALGREREQLEGWVPELASDAEVRGALEKAFDYRGDITITRKDGSQVQGYLFDRRTGATLADSMVRVMPSDGSGRVSIAYAEVAALVQKGRDFTLADQQLVGRKQPAAAVMPTGAPLLD